MKATSIKTIYLKEYELKQAIVEYIEKTEEELAQHLYDNDCSMEWKDGEYFVVSIDGEIEENDFICDGCGKKCESKEKKIIITKQLSGVVMCEECSGGNTTERVEEQAARLEKIAEQKEINKVVDQVEPAAIKAVHKVMEQHSKTLDDHTPECKWHKDWHACDCGAFDK